MKIIGNTVGMGLPKPNLKQTDPTKGDYVKGKDAFAKAEDVPTKVSQLDNDSGFLTHHQDISGKLDASKLPDAIEDALAQAKTSGEFDGKDGTSATHSWNGTILTVASASGTSSADLKGEDGGYYMPVVTQPEPDAVQFAWNASKTGMSSVPPIVAVLPEGPKGETGKTAYQYAKDGGYTGTETEFSAKLATPFVTPQMYGAKGDGTKDDTEAFERALAENNNVFVPKGDYLITRSLNLTYKKSLVSDDGQTPTIIYAGNETSSVVLIGRQSVFRNINIVVKNLFKGIVFDTHNFNQTSNLNGRHSRVEHTRIKFLVESKEAVLIGITVDSGTDANNIPLNTGNCYQTFNDIVVDNSAYYGIGIKMTLVQGRAFTEATKTGYPWMTHIVFNDIYLANPYTAIKAGVENTSGSEYFERIAMGHILFNNVTTQCQGIENTRYFLDVDHFAGYFSKCIGWDYHHITNDYGEKVNIIGEGVNLSFSDCEMNFGQELLKCCDFIAETDSKFTVEENPEYFMSKYFKGSFLSDGYDSVDAKIDAKLAGAYVANIVDEKINEVLYSGFTNILDNPLTQIKKSSRFSDSSQAWKVSNDNTTVIIPIVTGGNIIRWTPWAEATLEDFLQNKYALSYGYRSMFFFNDDELTKGILVEEWHKLWVGDENGGYLQLSNPNGYKYVSIPFFAYQDISPETMTMTINQKIAVDGGKSYTEYLKESVIDTAVVKKVGEEVEKLSIPTKVSQLDNDKGYLTDYTETDPTVPSWAKASSKPSYTKNEVGLGNVDNVKQYSEINPPPYPVTSVNGETGAVTVSVPSKTSQLTNDSGFITANDIPESQMPDLSAYSTTAQMKAYIEETFLGGAW